MKKSLLLASFCLSATVFAASKDVSESAHVQQQATTHFAATKALALNSQTKRIELLERERSCTEKAANREGLLACVKHTQEATRSMHEQHLAKIRAQYNVK